MNLPVNKSPELKEVTLVSKEPSPAETVEAPQRITVATPDLTIPLFDSPVAAAKTEESTPSAVSQPETFFRPVPPAIREPELEVTNTIPDITIAPKVDSPQTTASLEQVHIDRISKLKEMSMQLKKPGSIEELERQPAYMRRNVELTDISSSQESIQSRFTIGMDGTQQIGLKENNSFLHDNVD